MSIFRLGWTLTWRARRRVLALALLVGLGMSVFALVNELSRQSTAGLVEAISSDNGGTTGTYSFEFSSTLGVDPATLASLVAKATGPYRTVPMTIIRRIGEQRPECPPFDSLGEQTFLVVMNEDFEPIGLPFGNNLPTGTKLCLAGAELPRDAVLVPSLGEQRAWGIGLAIRPEYADLATLNAPRPDRYAFTVVTGQDVDQTTEILAALEKELDDLAEQSGERVTEVMAAARLDSGQQVRAASDGIELVYGVIGWSILLLAALGLSVAQFVSVSQRLWFFGLMRATGASRFRVATLVTIELGLVLLVGCVLAICFLFVAEPAVSSFTQQAFQVEADPLRWELAPQLLVGSVVVLALSASMPVRRALAQDPADTLEPAQG